MFCCGISFISTTKDHHELHAQERGNEKKVTFFRYFSGLQTQENTLIIHDHTTANIYLQEFTKRFNELSSTSIVNDLIDIDVNVFPNPSIGKINIESDLEINKIHVYQMDGKLIKIVTTQNFNLERNAIYYLKVFTNSGNAVKTIVVQ